MADPETKRVALVGHCGPDAYVLRSAVQRALPGAEVGFVTDDKALAEARATSDLLLVNRVLEGVFSKVSGVQLIRELSEDRSVRARTMLVSNYADAQSEAEAAGAAPGFGKAEIGEPTTAERLRAAVGQ